MGFSGDEAPGLDGFSMTFWQFLWDFVKDEVMSVFKEFHKYDNFVKSSNATFLVLIPKKGGVEDLRDFKPISLVSGLYKWLTKVLTNRLKNVGGVDDIDDLALDFGCKEGNVPSSYLGLPLGSSFKFVATWDGVKVSFHKKLAMWKR